MTRTFSTTNIAIVAEGHGSGHMTIYAEDYSHDTKKADIDAAPEGVHKALEIEHVRIFHSMREFTEWLQEMCAIVDNCRVFP